MGRNRSDHSERVQRATRFSPGIDSPPARISNSDFVNSARASAIVAERLRGGTKERVRRCSDRACGHVVRNVYEKCYFWFAGDLDATGQLAKK